MRVVGEEAIPTAATLGDGVKERGVFKHLGHVAFATIAVSALENFVGDGLGEMGLRVSPVGELVLDILDRQPHVVEERDIVESLGTLAQEEREDAVLRRNVRTSV